MWKNLCVHTYPRHLNIPHVICTKMLRESWRKIDKWFKLIVVIQIIHFFSRSNFLTSNRSNCHNLTTLDIWLNWASWWWELHHGFQKSKKMAITPIIPRISATRKYATSVSMGMLEIYNSQNRLDAKSNKLLRYCRKNHNTPLFLDYPSLEYMHFCQLAFARD